MLCILPHNNTNTQTQQNSFSFFEKLPQLMLEHPYIATIIATLVSFFSAKRFFSRSPYTPKHTDTIISPTTTAQQINHIKDSLHTVLYDCQTKQLTITHSEKAPIHIKHVIHYHMSKSAHYFVVNQLKKRTGLKKILKNVIFYDPDISDVYKFFQQYMHETLLINTQSGKIISLGSAISVEFNENEDELIILESHDPSFATILRNRILTKLWIARPIKATPLLEYKIFNLVENKYVQLPAPLINKHAVYFSPSQDIVIIDKQGKTTWTKNSNTTIDEHINCCPVIKYTFDEETNAYQLSLQSLHNTAEQIFDNVHYFYPTPDKKHLILYTIKNVQIIQGKTLLPDATKEKFITLIQNTSTETHIINTASGNKLYKSSGIIMSSPYNNDENNHLYILQQQDPTVGNINLEHILINEKNNHRFNDTHTLIISADNQIQLLEKNDSYYKTVNTKTFIQKGESLFKEVEQNTKEFVEQVKTIINPITPQKESNPICHTLTPDTISYYDYAYVGEKSAIDNETKQSYRKLLEQGIRGFEWNIYNFTKASFTTLLNTLKGPSNTKLCISNKKPHEMSYLSYKSLYAELTKVLTFMQKNNKAIITIFLNTNDCDPTIIDTEISTILQNNKYDPLLRPQYLNKSIAWPTIQDMCNNNKRLIFFNTTHNDSQLTHSMKKANHKLLSFFNENAKNKSQLFELANQENQRQITRIAHI